MHAFSDLTETEIIHRLAQANVSQPGVVSLEAAFPAEFWPEPPRPAAVLIPLLQLDGAWNILYTRRTPALVEHSGQVAFPGGRADLDDPDPETTALREAQEEIGLNPDDVRLLGRMGEFHTISNYRVTPVVGRIPWPYPFRLASEEVSRVFIIPLAWLADPQNWEERQRPLPPPYAPVSVIYFNLYDGELLWGISAALTLKFLRILAG
jgi:8-oxo-dGTP pyrophosphatase MutT (NUDIX family)